MSAGQTEAFMSQTTILIVEDEAIIAADLAGKLERLGYNVVGVAATGEQAVEMACGLRPRLVLMDIRLAGAMDGVEAAEAIRREHDAPVIYLTAHSDQATLARAKLTGPFGYILKPFEQRDLVTQIEMALYRHQADREIREHREWLRVTLASIGDAVIATDTALRITFINPVAESLTGWKAEEAAGEPLSDVFRIVNEQTGEGLDEPVSRALREGCVVELANHAALVTRDGRTVPVEDSAAPIRDAAGQVIGAVLVFHDVTERRRADDALRASEQHLRIVSDFTYDWEYWRSPENQFLYVSPACERVTGYTREEFIQDYGLYLRIVHPDDRQRVAAHLKEDQDLGETYEFEFRIVRREGDVRWIAHACRPVVDTDGRFMGRRASNRDITDRKRAEAEIESLARFPSENPYPVLRVATDATVLYCNAAGLGLLEQWGCETGHRVPDDWRKRVRESLQSDQCLTAETKCGRRVFSIVVAPVVAGGYVNLYARDVTEQKQAEDRLRKSHDELESLVARRTTYLARTVEDLRLSEYRLAEAQRMAHVGNWDWDIAGGTLWWSDEVYRIFGLAPQQFGATYDAFLSFVHPEDRPRVTDAVNHALAENKPYAIDHRVVRPDGSERIVHEQAETVLAAAGGPVRMMGTVQDVTELRRNEAALRSLTLELQLAEESEKRRIAHDLHDSVGQILAFSRRELAHIAKSVSDGAAQSLNGVGNHLQEAARQIRTLSFDLSPSVLYDLGLTPALEDMAERFSVEGGILCRITSDGALDGVEDAVKVLLYRSIRELVINAAKHADASQVEVRVRQADGHAHILVRDDGRGFDPSILGTRPSGHKGFGLISIRERLDHIGGHIHVESGRGRGTEITLVAPLSVGDATRGD